MSSNNEKDDNLTVSRVYDILKSPTFLKSLYWDILSNIKEKKTYKLMKEVAEGVLDQNMHILDGLTSNTEADNMRRKSIIAEVSVMSYTIDKVFSKILYMKLEKVCKEQIIKIIQQLKDEGKIPETVWSRFRMDTDIPENQTSTENTSKSNSAEQKKEIQKAPTRVGKRKRKVNSNYNVIQDIKKTNSNEEILDDLKKVNSIKYTDEDDKCDANNKKRNYQKKRVGDKAKEFPNESASNLNASQSSKSMIKENVSMPSTSKEISKDIALHIDNQDFSDAESEISVGSIASVSSVHTSDLSSFDDEISLSSDDESGEKKKIPLKEALKRYSGTGPSDFSTDKEVDVKPSKSKRKSTERVAEEKNIKKEVSVSSMTKSQSVFLESTNENGLSKRTRKPNSRYSSMFCPEVKVKDRRKTVLSTKTNGHTLSDDHSPKKKKTKVDDDIYVDVVTITESVKEESSSSNVKTPAKQPTTSNLFKPHSANRSLTSRRTAPLTLFST